MFSTRIKRGAGGSHPHMGDVGHQSLLLLGGRGEGFALCWGMLWLDWCFGSCFGEMENSCLQLGVHQHISSCKCMVEKWGTSWLALVHRDVLKLISFPYTSDAETEQLCRWGSGGAKPPVSASGWQHRDFLEVLHSPQITAVRVARALGVSLYRYWNINIFIIGVITMGCKIAILALTPSTWFKLRC